MNSYQTSTPASVILGSTLFQFLFAAYLWVYIVAKTETLYLPKMPSLNREVA